MHQNHLSPLVLFTLLAVILACGQVSALSMEQEPDLGMGRTDTPQATLPATPTQWPTPVNQEWRTVAMGVERRDMSVHGPILRFPAIVRLVRLDPSLVKIHTHYSPSVPITAAEWQRETQAMVVVNGGFFNAAKRTEGLMVSFGWTYGISYTEGGMFYIQGGRAGIRDLSEEPYRDGEIFEEAMQSYPMLIGEGGMPVVPVEDERYNRRTAIGVDTLGRVVLVAIDEPVVSLYELSRWLASSDLDLVSAVNLDGGSSTGMVVAIGDESLTMDSHGPIPIVIAAYP